jgi:hypothetical protein
VKFELIRGGINEEHVTHYNLIEAPDKPGYQWESLPEKAAEELVIGTLEKYWSLNAVRQVQHQENELTERWTKLIEELKS